MSETRAPGRFGTFAGVWTPSVLTILGVIMFMRAGFVVGDSGIWYALIILGIAKSITSLTTLSLSAIATNTEVGPGGNYFMISRVLGPEVGGTVGITLFISQAVAIAFYVIGFSEALFGLIAAASPDSMATIAEYSIEPLTSSLVIVLLFMLTFKGAEVAMKAQYIILAILMASVISFLVGGALAFDGELFSQNTGPIEGTVGFWAAFAIFFPAATGIDAGANMSGDLKDPAKSIPQGTFLAIGFTALVYVALLVMLAGYTDAATLVSDPFGSLQRMSVFGPLVIAGVFAATLSSALSSFLGAPRILQAMGKDKLLKPFLFFAVGHGPNDEPRRATVLSLAIALCIVWAGGLNAIAEIISMFFLISYGMINLSAFVEGRAGNPSFRPRFRLFGWPAALVGTIGCAIAMVKINETYAILSMLLAGLIYASLKGRTGGTFRDAKRGYTFAMTRDNLFELSEQVVDAKNWRPIVCALTSDAESDTTMISAASWLESGRGILSVLEVEESSQLDADARALHRRTRHIKVEGAMTARDIKGFAESVVTASTDAIESAVQAHSLGCLRPNTFVMSLPPPGSTRRDWAIRAGAAVTPLGSNIVLYKGASVERPKRERIDLWWHGERNGSLMALFAYLISSHREWRGVRIRMLRVVETHEEQAAAEQSLRKMMEAARIPVDIDVVLTKRRVSEVIIEKSGDADLLLLGLAPRDVSLLSLFLDDRDPFLAQLPPTMLILSSGEVDLLA